MRLNPVRCSTENFCNSFGVFVRLSPITISKGPGKVLATAPGPPLSKACRPERWSAIWSPLGPCGILCARIAASNYACSSNAETQL